ncbi:MAG: nodulation protein NfeD [Gemmatimonadetes bacterium]|nr:nodulation protein NfeD [Gemmatimonadota bacterium]MBT7863440.1 nodulation protein NfeD [Gemmatimonadota bacterium]
MRPLARFLSSIAVPLPPVLALGTVVLIAAVLMTSVQVTGAQDEMGVDSPDASKAENSSAERPDGDGSDSKLRGTGPDVPPVAKPVVHLIKLRTVNTEGGMIDPGLTAYVERVVEDADAADVDALVFDIDTFGGRVDAATVIRDAILNADLLTIAFINKRAISAGALISLACDKIVMASGGTIGASTPVSGAGEKASDKYVSVMRAEMRGTAERTDRDAEIAEAMVDERIYIPDFSDEVGQPATLTTQQALHYGIADESAETLHAVLEIYDLADAEIVEIDINWAEHVVRLLTHPVVTSILLAVAFFGMMAEVKTPGWGLGGSMALIALAIFFGSHLIVHLANWEELALFGIGLLLLFVEIALIPGFGLAGLAGFLCMIASILLTRLPSFDFWSVEDISIVVGQFSLSLIGAIIVASFVLKSLPKVAAFNRLILGSETKAADGYVSAPTEDDETLVGQTGVTVSELRPVGIGSFDGRRLDIIADGEFIEAQRLVKIVSAHGARIVVRAV